MKKTILGVFTAMAIINNVSAAEQKLPTRTGKAACR